MSKPIQIPGHLISTKGNKIQGVRNLVIVNDEYTVENFIIALLLNIFDKSDKEVFNMIKDFRRDNSVIAGTFSQDVVETKVKQASDFAQKRNKHLVIITTDAKQ